MTLLIAIIIGYLIGSISPAYYFGKRAGKDLRKLGDGNLGATNVKNVLGWKPGLATLIIDLSKGLIAVAISFALGLSLEFSILAGFAAVLGHVFPVYFSFSGGQGMATSVGLFFFLLYLLISQSGFDSFNLFVISTLILAGFALFIKLYLKREDLIGIITLPIFTFFLLYNHPLNYLLAEVLIIMGYIFLIQVYNLRKNYL